MFRNKFVFGLELHFSYHLWGYNYEVPWDYSWIPIVFLIVVFSYLSNKFGFCILAIIFLWNWKPWMFSEDYRRAVYLDDLDAGLDWNALITLPQNNVKSSHQPLYRPGYSIWKKGGETEKVRMRFATFANVVLNYISL